ncbi:MAG: hypothetical protein ACREP6_13520 [Candidatus Binataceae bacterium]
MRLLSRYAASSAALALIILMLDLAGCGTHLDCGRATQDRIAGQSDASIAASMGVTEHYLDTHCY